MVQEDQDPSLRPGTVYWDYVVTGLLLMWTVCVMMHSIRSYFSELFYCSTHWAIELIPLP